MKNNELITARNLVSLLLAHIDQHLIVDNNVSYDAEEIRKQLELSGIEILNAMHNGGYEIDAHIQTHHSFFNQ